MNKNILLQLKNIIIFKIENNYSFKIENISNRSPKILIKEIDKILEELDSYFLTFRNNTTNSSDILIENYAFKVSCTTNEITDKNNIIRNIKNYTLSVNSVYFSSQEEVCRYVINLLLSIKNCLFEITNEYVEEDIDTEIIAAEDVLDIE